VKTLERMMNYIPLWDRWSRRRKVGRWRQRYEQWQKAGAELPMPHYGKQLVVADYGRRFQTPVLIETGTYTGHMVLAMIDVFQSIYSIELDKTLAERATKTFAHHRHVRILQGDSEQRLPEILRQINQPCLFWLDAHYSGGQTAKGQRDTPIERELAAIFSHPLSRQHVLLIDDARCFTGQNDYPTLDELRSRILGIYPDWTFEVKDDIIRAHAPGGKTASGKP